jgi:hypothetical protein
MLSRTGKGDSWPLDHDHVDQIRFGRDLILRVACGSGDPGSSARGDGGAVAGLELPEAVLLDSSSDFIEFDAPRVISTKVWVRGARCGTRNPPEHSFGLGGCPEMRLHRRRRVYVA